MASGYPPSRPSFEGDEFPSFVRRPSATRPWSISSMTAKALRPATALPVTLVGRDSHGYYGLSVPVPKLAIRQPTLAGVGSGSGVAHVASFVLP